MTPSADLHHAYRRSAEYIRSRNLLVTPRQIWSAVFLCQPDRFVISFLLCFVLSEQSQQETESTNFIKTYSLNAIQNISFQFCGVRFYQVLEYLVRLIRFPVSGKVGLDAWPSPISQWKGKPLSVLSTFSTIMTVAIIVEKLFYPSGSTFMGTGKED